MMTDPSEALTRRELYAQEDETRAEIERDLEHYQSAAYSTLDENRWERAHPDIGPERDNQIVKIWRNQRRILEYRKEIEKLRQRRDTPSEVTAWEGYSA